MGRAAFLTAHRIPVNARQPRQILVVCLFCVKFQPADMRLVPMQPLPTNVFQSCKLNRRCHFSVQQEEALILVWIQKLHDGASFKRLKVQGHELCALPPAAVRLHFGGQHKKSCDQVRFTIPGTSHLIILRGVYMCL